MPVLELEVLEALLDKPDTIEQFVVPAGWPTGIERDHVVRWVGLAEIDGGASPWRARALVDRQGVMVGHAGFHAPPVDLDAALADPTFEGLAAPCSGGAVEIGYMVFPDRRGRGYATEAAAGLIQWAFATGEVEAILATVATDNHPSLAVLAKLGFERIGTCLDDGVTEIVFRRDRRIVQP